MYYWNNYLILVKIKIYEMSTIEGNRQTVSLKLVLCNPKKISTMHFLYIPKKDKSLGQV